MESAVWAAVCFFVGYGIGVYRAGQVYKHTWLGRAKVLDEEDHWTRPG